MLGSFADSILWKAVNLTKLTMLLSYGEMWDPSIGHANWAYRFQVRYKSNVLTQNPELNGFLILPMLGSEFKIYA